MESGKKGNRGGGGLGLKLMGPREAEVMEMMWERGRATVAEVRAALGSRDKVAYTTIMTIMSRLAEKGFLRRTLVGNAYVYFPRVSKEEMGEGALRRFLTAMANHFGEAALIHFVRRLAERDQRVWEDLERMVEERRKAAEK